MRRGNESRPVSLGLLRCLFGLLACPFLPFICGASADMTGSVQQATALKLTLQQCLDMAMEHNAAIHVANAERDAAASRKRIAFAQYLPKLVMTAQYTRLDEVRSFSTKMDETFRDISLDTAAWWGIAQSAGTAAANAAYDNRAVDPFQTFNQARAQAAADFPRVQSEPILGQNVLEAQVLLTQPLFTGGKIRHGNKMAELDEQIRNLGVDVRRKDVALDVTNAYWAAVVSDQIAGELDSLAKRLVALRDATQRALDAGSQKTSMLDIARTDVAIEATRQDLADVQRGEAVSLAVLREVMGLEDDRQLVLADGLPSLGAAPRTLEECESLALGGRSEIRQARSAIALRTHGVAAAKANFAPDVAAFGGVRYLNDGADFANPNDNQEWFAGISLTLPIFEGFSRTAKVAEARSEVRKASWVEAQARRGIRLQVQEAYHSLQAAVRKVEDADRMVTAADRLKTVTSAARAQNIAADFRRMLKLGDKPELVEFKVVPDVPEQLDAEIGVSKARIARSRARFEAATALARLERAVGVALPKADGR